MGGDLKFVCGFWARGKGSRLCWYDRGGVGMICGGDIIIYNYIKNNCGII